MQNLSAESLVRVHPNSQRFGMAVIDENMTALTNALRRMADDIDAGVVIVTKIETSEAASLEDFPASSLCLQFTRHKEQP